MKRHRGHPDFSPATTTIIAHRRWPASSNTLSATSRKSGKRTNTREGLGTAVAARLGCVVPREVLSNRFRLGTADDCGERGLIRLRYRADAAEVFQQASPRAFADAGDLQQLGVAVAHLAALAVESHGEAGRLV